MSNGLAKKGKVLSALERLDSVEQVQGKILGDLSAIEQYVNADKKSRELRFAALVELSEALVDVVGREKVDAILAEKRAKRDAERIVAADKKVDDMLLNGEIVVGAEVTDKSLVIGVETEKDTGKALSPGKFYVDFPNFFPEIQVLLLGKTANDSVTTPNGNTITITGVYERVKKEEAKSETASTTAADDQKTEAK